MPSLTKERIMFPLDVPTPEEAKRLISLLAGEVGFFKVGLELFIKSGPAMVEYILSEGKAQVFLDLKLHDIPATVERATRVVSEMGVAFATVHCGESSAMLEAAVRGARGKTKILGVTVLTSVHSSDIEQSGFKNAYVNDMSKLVVKRARMAQQAGCAGVVSSGLEVPMIKTACGPDFISVTPGIRPQWDVVDGDDQKRVTTPSEAIANGSDYLVIGRPIRDAKDPVDAARKIASEIAYSS